MGTKHMLTTIDNPFNPFTQYEEWNAYDVAQGHHTNSMLARIARLSDELSEKDYELALELAIDEIVQENVLGVHMKVPEPEA